MDNKINIFPIMRILKDTMEKNANNHLKKSGLTVRQGHILIYLFHKYKEQASLKDIEKHLQVAQPTCLGIVARLEEKQFVTTFFNDEDKRAKLVKLTDKGKEIVTITNESIDKAHEKILKPLSDIEKTVFAQLLQKINDGIE